MKYGVAQHIHKRKRMKNQEPKYKYPCPDPKIRILDKIVLVVAFVAPLASIPQIAKIWIEQTAAGLSLYTWITFLILGIPMLFYGIVHKEKPLIVMYFLWIIMHSATIAGILAFG